MHAKSMPGRSLPRLSGTVPARSSRSQRALLSLPASHVPTTRTRRSPSSVAWAPGASSPSGLPWARSPLPWCVPRHGGCGGASKPRFDGFPPARRRKTRPPKIIPLGHGVAPLLSRGNGHPPGRGQLAPAPSRSRLHRCQMSRAATAPVVPGHGQPERRAPRDQPQVVAARPRGVQNVPPLLRMGRRLLGGPLQSDDHGTPAGLSALPRRSAPGPQPPARRRPRHAALRRQPTGGSGKRWNPISIMVFAVKRRRGCRGVAAAVAATSVRRPLPRSSRHRRAALRSQRAKRVLAP